MQKTEINSNSPIGVFDSGFGGLTALRELAKIMPNEDIIYFGDTARVPYGTRSYSTLCGYASQDMNFLKKNNVKAILIACGTVSSVIYNIDPEYKNCFTMPVIGTIEPSCRKALELTNNGKIGVWGTQATVKSKSFVKELSKLSLKQGIKIETCAVPCPLLVPLIENGYTDINCEITRLAVDEYLSSIVSFGVDTLILACTHFPLISDLIEREWHSCGGGKIVNSGKQAALELKRILAEKHMLNKNTTTGKVTIYSSDDMDTFSSQARIFLGFDDNTAYSSFDNICFAKEKTDIDRY